jgi:ATP-dependent Clp protease ATP-binding subunit ClpA
MFERFTQRARRVLVLAQEEARLLGHPFIGTEHVLLGLIQEADGVAALALQSLDISLEAVREKVIEAIGKAGAPPGGSPPFTPRAKKVLEYSLREAQQLGHNYIGTEHILLGLVREGEGVAAAVLVSLGADLHRVRQRVIQLVSGVQNPEAFRPTPWSQARGPVPVVCSFCDRLPADGQRLVAGSDAFICEYCVSEWAQRLSEGEGEFKDDEGSTPPKAYLLRLRVEPAEAQGEDQEDGEDE